MATINHSITVSIMGEVESGKTSFIRRLATAKFDEAVRDESFGPLQFNTNYGPITLNLVESDVASDCIVYLFDGPDTAFFAERFNTAKAAVGNSKVIFVLNKVDVLKEAKVSTLKPEGVELYLFSAKTCLGFETLESAILRTFSGRPDIKVVPEE